MCLDGTAVQQPEPSFLNENGPIKPDRSTEYQKVFSEYKLTVKLREECQRKIEVLEYLITQSSEQYAK